MNSELNCNRFRLKRNFANDFSSSGFLILFCMGKLSSILFFIMIYCKLFLKHNKKLWHCLFNLGSIFHLRVSIEFFWWKGLLLYKSLRKVKWKSVFHWNSFEGQMKNVTATQYLKSHTHLIPHEFLIFILKKSNSIANYFSR